MPVSCSSLMQRSADLIINSSEDSRILAARGSMVAEHANEQAISDGKADSLLPVDLWTALVFQGLTIMNNTSTEIELTVKNKHRTSFSM